MKKTVKKSKSPLPLILLALVPVASALLYLLLMMITPDVFWDLGKIPIMRPIGQQNVSEFSVIDILIIAATVFVWGSCGAYASKKASLIKSTLIANAVPIVCTLIYVVLNIAVMAGGADTLTDIAAVSTLGLGLFSLIGTLVYQLVAANVAEVFVDLVIMTGVFIVGYCIGSAKEKKKK